MTHVVVSSPRLDTPRPDGGPAPGGPGFPEAMGGGLEGALAGGPPEMNPRPDGHVRWTGAPAP